MPTVFDTLSERFFTAYCEPDAKKRRKAVDKWVDSAVPVMQKAIKEDLRAYLDQILETRWTDAGWQSGMKKFQRIMGDYRLVMNVQITNPGQKYLKYVGPVSPAEKEKTKKLMEATISGFEETKEAGEPQSQRENQIRQSDDGGEGNGGSGGRTSNDDRSDSMNPNNSAYHASMDNRSNQMNPNNPTYHSSRGHGRR